jgi:hypothetical protein
MGIIILFVILIWIWYKTIKKGIEPYKKQQTSIKIHDPNLPYKRFLTKEMCSLLQRYKIVNPVFISKFCTFFLQNSSFIEIKKEDLIDGVDLNYAKWVYKHCLRIARARYNATNSIHIAKLSEARYIDLDVERPCSECDFSPKDKRYSIYDEIPIFPCDFCDKNFDCIVFYNAIY